uniref:proline-rich proteoglycan 2-like n=1 Tax=Panthera onca TaxID=9690 RepID=UPI0029552F86|nr:proline-rich proteoglycan 2-like [Panthera onca]
MKTLQTSPGPNWEVAEGEVPTQPPEEGGSLGISRDLCRSLGEQMPQQRGRESPGSGERAAQRRESAPGAGEQRAAGERVPTPLPPPRPPTRPRLLPRPGAETLEAPSTGSSGQQERPPAPRGHPGLVPDPHGLQDRGESPGPAEQVPGAGGEPRGNAEAPKASKAAWPWPPGREKASAGVSAVQQETALQRLLELHRAARRRRRQDREQQRLRVLECLRIARNRHCRVHPLGPPPSPAQLPPQARLPEGGGVTTIRARAGGTRGWGRGGLGPSWARLLDAFGVHTCTDPDGGREGGVSPGAAPCWLHQARGVQGRGAQRSAPPQEDAAGQRRALRQQLQQVHRERTRRLRALGARNTQNFQQLLWPRTEDPLPGEEPSPFAAPSSHC